MFWDFFWQAFSLLFVAAFVFAMTGAFRAAMRSGRAPVAQRPCCRAPDCDPCWDPPDGECPRGFCLVHCVCWCRKDHPR